MIRFCLFVFVIALVCPRLCAQSEEASKIGPAKNGLCLQLVTKHVGGPKSENSITVKLINQSEETKTLTTAFYYEGSDTFRDFFKQSVSFTAFPEILESPFSTSGTARTSPQARLKLKPGESQTMHMKTPGSFLSGGSLTHSTLSFQKPGKYFIRAHVVLYDGDGKAFRLWSNESQFVVGNSKDAPEPSVAKILRYVEGEEKEVAILSLGEKDGVEIGDEFAHWSKAGGFQFKITKVSKHSCRAEVTPYENRGRGQAKRPAAGTKISYSKNRRRR